MDERSRLSAWLDIAIIDTDSSSSKSIVCLDHVAGRSLLLVYSTDSVEY